MIAPLSTDPATERALELTRGFVATYEIPLDFRTQAVIFLAFRDLCRQHERTWVDVALACGARLLARVKRIARR